MQFLRFDSKKRRNRVLAYTLTFCMLLTCLFSAPLTGYADVTDAYLQNGVGLGTIVPEDVVVFGSSTMTSGKGFLGNFTYLTEDNITDLRSGTVTTGALGLGNSWVEDKNYSSYCNHGTPNWHYQCVDGIDLETAFAALGITGDSLSVTVKATDGYKKTIGNAFAGGRYYIDPKGEQGAEVGPMLVLNRDQVESSATPVSTSAVTAPVAATTAVDPIFGYGQVTYDEHTNCNWVTDTNKVVAGTETASDSALSVTTTDGTQLDMSIWEMVRLGVYETTFSYQKGTNDLNHAVKGIPLNTLLTAMGVTLTATDEVEFATSDSYTRPLGNTIPYDDLDNWFVAYEASVAGVAQTNETALRLYGPGQYGNAGIVQNLSTFTVIDTTDDGYKHPYTAGDDISDSVFYLAVETSSGGAVNYYYYTQEELEELEATANFAYNDHSVNKTVTAKGAPLTSMFNNITGAAITDDMIIQYAEQDGYHADAATAIANSDYKDKVEWLDTSHVSGTTIAPAQTVIAYGIHEEYQTPDANNVNDAAGVYKDADNNSGYLRAYRNTGSNAYDANIGGANATVIKYLMGVVVSYSGSIFQGNDGYIQKTVSDKNATIAVAAPVTVTGLMPGMKFAAQAPAVVNASLKSGEAAYQVIDVVDGSAQTVTFTYTENTYFYVDNGDTETEYVYTDLVANTAQTPVAADYAGLANYGYSAPMYYRYNGVWLSTLLTGITGIQSITVTATDGTTSSIAAADASKYFVAYSNTHSKSSTNTAEGKRVTTTYENAMLLIPSGGTIVTSSAINNTGTSVGNNVTTAVASTEGVTLVFASSGGGGGGSSSGGSGTSSDSQSDSSASTVTTTDTVTGTVSGGKAVSTVSSGDIAGLITKIKKEIAAETAADGDTVNSVIEIAQELNGSGAANSTQIDLPVSGLSKIVSDTDSDLKITTAVAEITFDQDALKTIAEGASGTELSISAEKLTASDNPAVAQLLAEGRPVFDFTVASGEQKISDFNGTVSLSVPYTLGEGEDPDGVVIYYVADDGTITEVENAVYNSTTGCVDFTTEHFSNYAIGYDPSAVWTNPFSDVQESAWYFSYVKEACAAELFSGTSTTLFSPNGGMTRAMFVTVLGRMAGIDAASYSKTAFSDVQAGCWYAPYVAWAVEKGIVSGVGNGKFDPDAAITREAMATILLNYYKASGEDVATATGELSYSDKGKISAWAVDGVRFCQEKGLLNGYTDGTFAPGKTATRAEVAVITTKAAK